uniref:Cytochrome b6-f complex subunit 6 n=5 Tax=Cheilanthoideae TaxID=2003546 RepID=A0A3G5CST0_9MONI|nr:cytochrome b6/f complex 3.5 kDa subunit [Myriopteris scabra]AYW15919.1 cytochrome b6/f complex 3.5 kDa subunit [Myriopteris scabra]
MLTSLSYFAFLMLALSFTLAIFVGLNKIQILQLTFYYPPKKREGEQKRERVFRRQRLLIRRTYQRLILS